MEITRGVRVKVARIDDSEPSDLYDVFVGKEGTVIDHYDYTGGWFSPPWGVRFDDGDSLYFYGMELEVIDGFRPWELQRRAEA